MVAANTRRQVRRGAARAFTLIEVMIVIAIVLALSGLVGYALLGRRDEAKRDLAKVDMNNLAGALKLFHFDFERYPTDEEGLKVLWDKSALSAEAEQGKWHAYMEAPMAKDRWGSDWGYRQVSENGDETKYDLWSYGPDKQDGTEDDLTSWSATGGEGGEGSDGSADMPPPPPPPAS